MWYDSHNIVCDSREVEDQERKERDEYISKIQKQQVERLHRYLSAKEKTISAHENAHLYAYHKVITRSAFHICKIIKNRFTKKFRIAHISIAHMHIRNRTE